jgi:transposase
MEINEEQYRRIEGCLPVQRGNVSLSNRQVLNAILFVAEQGCKWRGLPARFGNWHTIYTRMNRWSKAGVLDRVFERLQREQIIRIKLEAVSLDSTMVKVHPDGTGALKKRAASHRQIARGMDHQDPSGCRECSVRPELCALARPDRRRARGPQPAEKLGSNTHALPLDHGPCLRGR